jgi:hypothetical protein
MVMAGFDKVDPAYPCLIGGVARVFARAGLYMAAGPVSNLIEKCQRAGWTRALQWSKNTRCTGEPGSQAGCACGSHD